MTEPASSVPPFIPGLLIVGLLIIISIIIGWRNYVRRGDRRFVPGMGDWAFWDETVAGEGGGRPEKPKLWEVGIAAEQQCVENVEKWECIMPLSAMSLAAELHNPTISSDPELSRHRMTSSPVLNSRMSHLNFLSSPDSPPSPSPDRLQISVLISMPSPHRLHWQRQKPNTDTKCENSSEDLVESPTFLAETRRQSTSSSVRKERLGMDVDGKDGSPECVIGVAVLPWQREDDDQGGGITVP